MTGDLQSCRANSNFENDVSQTSAVIQILYSSYEPDGPRDEDMDFGGWEAQHEAAQNQSSGPAEGSPPPNPHSAQVFGGPLTSAHTRENYP